VYPAEKLIHIHSEIQTQVYWAFKSPSNVRLTL